MNNRSLQISIGLSGALAVAFGALGAHYLKQQASAGLLTEDQLNGFDTGARYHLIHTLALFAVLLLRKEEKRYTASIRFFSWGIICFSGSLYLLCTRTLWGAEWLRYLGPVTPLGGILLILGWLSLAGEARKKGKS